MCLRWSGISCSVLKRQCTEYMPLRASLCVTCMAPLCFLIPELNLLHPIARAGEFSMASVFVRGSVFVARRRLLSSANRRYVRHSATP